MAAILPNATPATSGFLFHKISTMLFFTIQSLPPLADTPGQGWIQTLPDPGLELGKQPESQG